MTTLPEIEVTESIANIPDVRIIGAAQHFRLLCKISSANEGWTKTFQAYEITDVGCIVHCQTTGQNMDGTSNRSEAMTFVPGVVIEALENGDRILVKQPIA